MCIDTLVPEVFRYTCAEGVSIYVGPAPLLDQNLGVKLFQIRFAFLEGGGGLRYHSVWWTVQIRSHMWPRVGGCEAILTFVRPLGHSIRLSSLEEQA